MILSKTSMTGVDIPAKEPKAHAQVKTNEVTQWLSGRVLDWELRGCLLNFQPRQCGFSLD